MVPRSFEDFLLLNESFPSCGRIPTIAPRPLSRLQKKNPSVIWRWDVTHLSDDQGLVQLLHSPGSMFREIDGNAPMFFARASP